MELVVQYVSVFLEGRVEVLDDVGGDYDSRVVRTILRAKSDQRLQVGHEKVLYVIWQEVLRKYFMPYGKKYSWHMPFGKGSGQCNSTSYLMPLCLLLFQANAYPFSY
jgi:hypothetical protein